MKFLIIFFAAFLFAKEIFFVHMADVHLMNDYEIKKIFKGNLSAVNETKKAVNEIIALKPELVIQTGDIVGLSDNFYYKRDENWFKLAQNLIVKPIVNAKIPFAYVPGNHDISGVKLKRINKNDPRFYNGLSFEYIEPLSVNKTKNTFFSYKKDGYVFIFLDPKETPKSKFRNVILPKNQREWLKKQISLNKDAFFIISFHQPLGSWEIESFKEFIKIVEPVKKRTVLLTGHTHDNRIMTYNGIKEYQDGAICGDWWKSGKTPNGFPIGYAIYFIKDAKIYRFYRAIDKTDQINLIAPQNTVLNTPQNVKINAHFSQNLINAYYILGNEKHPLKIKKIQTPAFSWYEITGTITPKPDGKFHNVRFVFKTAGNTFSKTYLYKFSKNPFFTIQEIKTKYFKQFFGREVTVKATILKTKKNVVLIGDSSGEIYVWMGDTVHPKLKKGQKIILKAFVTEFINKKELKLIKPNDIKVQ